MPCVDVISIHAPAKGATVRAGCICLHSAYFNPRSREGSDNTVHFVIAFCIISIHAPAKGATLRIFHLFCNSQNFNPRSREGSDRGRQRLSIKLYNFNPRSREGSDHVVADPFKITYSRFQSTLPRRERPYVRVRVSGAGPISIHAPAKGATQSRRIYLCRQRISIHAPAKGATVIFPLSSCSVTFQSTLPRRERLCSATPTETRRVFQSTLPRRERP